MFKPFMYSIIQVDSLSSAECAYRCIKKKDCDTFCFDDARQHCSLHLSSKSMQRSDSDDVGFDLSIHWLPDSCYRNGEIYTFG